LKGSQNCETTRRKETQTILNSIMSQTQTHLACQNIPDFHYQHSSLLNIILTAADNEGKLIDGNT